VGYPGATLERLTEEHGLLAVTGGHDLKVGDTLRIIPNHVCSTVNLHDAVYLVGESGAVEEVRVARPAGKCGEERRCEAWYSRMSRSR
jgi:D-serine deaminase-like pyridoxal phosphate-dependent protein